jgi:hypothetical protein
MASRLQARHIRQAWAVISEKTTELLAAERTDAEPLAMNGHAH